MPNEVAFEDLEIDEQFRLVSNPNILYQKYDHESAIAVEPFLFESQANCIRYYEDGEEE